MPCRSSSSAFASCLGACVVLACVLGACSDDAATTPPASDAGAQTDGPARGDADAPEADAAADTASPDPDPDASRTYTEAQYCADREARATKCGETGDSEPCAEGYACIQKLRAEVRDEIGRCLTARACDASDDNCFVNAASRFAPETGTFVDDCMAKRQSCTGAGISDDFCSVTVALGGAPVIAAMKDCLAEPCGDVEACFITALAPISCK